MNRVEEGGKGKQWQETWDEIKGYKGREREESQGSRGGKSVEETKEGN